MACKKAVSEKTNDLMRLRVTQSVCTGAVSEKMIGFGVMCGGRVCSVFTTLCVKLWGSFVGLRGSFEAVGTRTVIRPPVGFWACEATPA